MRLWLVLIGLTCIFQFAAHADTVDMKQIRRQFAAKDKTIAELRNELARAKARIRELEKALASHGDDSSASTEATNDANADNNDHRLTNAELDKDLSGESVEDQEQTLQDMANGYDASAKYFVQVHGNGAGPDLNRIYGADGVENIAWENEMLCLKKLEAIAKAHS